MEDNETYEDKVVKAEYTYESLKDKVHDLFEKNKLLEKQLDILKKEVIDFLESDYGDTRSEALNYINDLFKDKLNGGIIMDTYEFEKVCKNAIINYYKENSEITDNVELNIQNVYVVWLCKTLQNMKALLSTTLYDGMYFECTYNGDKNELYLDAYKKWKNIKIEKKDFDSEAH